MAINLEHFYFGSPEGAKLSLAANSLDILNYSWRITATGLATSWEQLDDTTLRFKLRGGIKFHNGNAFTADDVVASIARITDPASGVQANASTIKDAVAVDKYTVDIRLVKKTGIALNELTGVMIISQPWLAAETH